MRQSLPLAAFVLLLAFFVAQLTVFAQNLPKNRLFRHHHTVVWSCISTGVRAFVYESGMAIDADGAYRAYHPENRPGLDSLNHAGHRGNWWALATDTGDPNGRPLIQGKTDPAPGFYVSMTSLYDSRIPDESNPHRFVDAATIPYIVFPPEGLKYARLGDLATVVNLQNGKRASAIVADVSAPNLPMGEGSIALANLLGIDSDARTGGTDRGIAYVVYPNSGNGEPRSLQQIDRISPADFDQWGGIVRLHSCLQ